MWKTWSYLPSGVIKPNPRSETIFCTLRSSVGSLPGERPIRGIREDELALSREARLAHPFGKGVRHRRDRDHLVKSRLDRAPGYFNAVVRMANYESRPSRSLLQTHGRTVAGLRLWLHTLQHAHSRTRDPPGQPRGLQRPPGIPREFSD
jgi:hypothetical protein